MAPIGHDDVIARAQQGDENAFETLFHTYKRRVYSLCLRMTGNVADAEEATQEVFLLLFRKIHTFRGESAFSTWLLRIALNIVLMRRRKKKLPEVPIEAGNNEEESDWTRTEFGSPDRNLEGVVDRHQLDLAIAELPTGYRQVFELHDVMGYQHHEISEILGYSEGNSKSQLHKARMRLRKLLGHRMRPGGKTTIKVATQDEEDKDKGVPRRDARSGKLNSSFMQLIAFAFADRGAD
jgi:RNA polymerase sigma-70 factor (ECF subfamily)